MKTYYIECSVHYTNKQMLTEEGYSYYDDELYRFIIQANTKKSAETQAKQQTIERFNEELNEDYDDISVIIEDCYETTDDARL